MTSNLDGFGKDIFFKKLSRCVNRIIFVFLALLFLLPIEILYGREPHRLEREGVIVFYDEALRKGAEEAAHIYPKVKRDISRVLPWEVNFTSTILLVKKSETFQRMAGNDFVVAFAVPERNLMVIDYSKMNKDPFSIETTMKHELCHLLLHHQVGDGKLPKWLDEGLAQWVSQGIAEIMITQKRSVLNETVLKGQYLRIRTLTHRFPWERKSLLLAYEASKSFVEYLIQQHGIDGRSESAGCDRKGPSGLRLGCIAKQRD